MEGLTRRQMQLIRQSFDSAAEFQIAFTKLFYGRLFELQPTVRPLFKVSIEEQSKKLLDTLRAIVDGVDRIDELRPKLRELGRKHVTYGVKPEYYDVLRSALLWTFAQALGVEFDAETRAVWDKVLRLVSAIMLEG
jgi:hemoglobin-like flavoprotein